VFGAAVALFTFVGWGYFCIV